jgi:hypothetical protein
VSNPEISSNLFTVKVFHNGYFSGRGVLSYDESSVDHFDNCSADTWSHLWIGEILEILGVQKDARVHVYWLMPWFGGNAA